MILVFDLQLSKGMKQIITANTVAILFLTVSPSVAMAGPISEKQREARLDHAQELLGSYYDKSIVSTGEEVEKVNSKIYVWVRERLPKKHKRHYKKVAQTIIDESLRYNFDPIFLMSMIQGESGFDPERIGPFKEIGLMQILPPTGKWIADMYGIRWTGKKILNDPIINIKIGAAFLSHLRNRFDDHPRLYLSAYNMGQGNVRKLLKRKLWPKKYVKHVMGYYVKFYETLAQDRASDQKLAQN